MERFLQQYQSDITGVLNSETERRESIKAGGAQVSLRYYF